MHIFVISLHQIGGNKNSGTEKCIRKITVSWIPVEDEMKHLCYEQEWLLYVVTVCLAAGFTIAGFYALAAAGDIRKLPLRRLVMIAIVGLYSIRVIVGIGWLLYEFTYLQFISTLVPAFLVYCYLPGLKRDVNNQMLP